MQGLWRRTHSCEPPLTMASRPEDAPEQLFLPLLYLGVNLAHLNAWHPAFCQFVQTSEYCESGSTHSCCFLSNAPLAPRSIIVLQ